MALQDFLEKEIERLMKKKIEELLAEYSHNEQKVTDDLENKKSKYSEEIAKKITNAAKNIYNREVSRAGEKEFNKYVEAVTEKAFEERIKNHKKMSRFEDKMNEWGTWADKKFHTLSKDERSAIKKRYIEDTKDEFIKKGLITQELYDKVLDKREKEKKKKDAAKAEEKEILRLAKESIKGRKEVSRTTEGLFDASKASEVAVGTELGERDGFFRRKISRKGRKKSRERYYAFMKWYNQEMENLRAAYAKDDIDKEEFVRREDELNKHLKEQTGVGGIRRIGKKFKKLESHHYASQMKSVIYLLAAVLIGAIITGTTGSWMFFVGFLGVGLYLVAPDPKNIEEKPGQKITLMTLFSVGKESRSKQTTAGMLRSLGKVTAIAFFAFGFQGLGDIFNTLYIATAIVGYFLLKVEYESSPEFIESLLRFFLGMIMIPWIFNDIFDSLILAGIAFAFFAIPPLPNSSNKNMGEVMSRGLSGATAYYEMAEKFIFGGIMIVVLVASGSLGPLGGFANTGWELTGTLKYTFIYFWLVCGVAGFFSPAKERPVTGGIMLAAATIIYGIGPGSQQIGSGLLGQWWPSVHETFTSVTEPISSLMGSLGSTFSAGFMLLTNPVGYATQLMNGSYADNPLGPTGSYGVDVTELTVSNIFPVQPFVVAAILENKGAYEADNVRMSILAVAPDKFATTGSSRTEDSPIWRDETTLDIYKLGFGKKTDNPPGSCDDVVKSTVYKQNTDECIQNYDSGSLGKLMVWQASFYSTGLSCANIVELSLRKKSLPITAKVEYDYKSDSRVEVEFISKAEWDRLAQAGELDSNKFRFIQSQYSSAPVKFPIGTAGMKNPIGSDQAYHISMLLDSAFDKDSEIKNVKRVELNYPSEWNIKYCQAYNGMPGTINSDNGNVYWEPRSGGAKTFYCYFDALGDENMGGAPTKTYIVTANASYSFSRWKTKLAKIEFGGFCCPNSVEEIKRETCKTGIPDPGDDSYWDKFIGSGICASDDCLKNQKCVNNACVYGGIDTTVDVSTLEGYCGNRLKYQETNMEGTYGCHLGMGECTGTSDCLNTQAVGDEAVISSIWSDFSKDGQVLKSDLTCQDTGYGVKACCYDATKEACGAAFMEWRSQTIKNPSLLSGKYYYPDEKTIHTVYCNAIPESERSKYNFC